MITWRVYSYDVWGNKRDGYEVNNVFRTSEYFDSPDDPTDAQLLKSMKDAGIVKKGIRTSSVEFEDNGGEGKNLTIYISYKGRPEFEIRRESRS